MNQKNNFQEERRQYKRIEKHFVISYHDKNDPTIKHDVSQVKNISLGGMCFITSKRFPPSTEFHLELKTPYVPQTVALDGKVLESREKVADILYETRIEFGDLGKEVKEVFKKIIEKFSKI